MMNISRELKVTNNSPINITVQLVEKDGHPGTTHLEVHLHDPICYAIAEDPYLRCDMVGQRKEEYQRMKLECVVGGLVSMIRNQIMDCLEAGGAFHE